MSRCMYQWETERRSYNGKEVIHLSQCEKEGIRFKVDKLSSHLSMPKYLTFCKECYKYLDHEIETICDTVHMEWFDE